MAIIDIAERLQKLRDMREKLCKKEKSWDEAFQARDWIVDHLNKLHRMAESENYTKDDIKNRIADVLCVLDPEEDNDDK